MASAIGATAISRVIRSSSMARSSTSRSKRRCRRTGRARRGSGQQVQQSEDVRRRRGDLEAVVVPEAERTAPVRRGQGDRRVRMTDGLGGVRRAGAENQDGVVGRPDRRVRWWQGTGAVDDVGRVPCRRGRGHGRRRPARPAVPRRGRRPRRSRALSAARRCRPRAPSRPGSSGPGPRPACWRPRRRRRIPGGWSSLRPPGRAGRHRG